MRKIILVLLSALLIADLSYSFLQHKAKTLDGDLPGGIMPAQDVRHVLLDPLGWKAITEDTIYPNPNRFFSHATFYHYFNHVPFLLQNITDPVNSLYLSAAIFKTMVQFILILQISLTLSRKKRDLKSVLLAAVFVIPFFQTNGFQSQIGIIDASITYVFFYAYPLIFLLHYFMPVFRFYLYDEKISDNKWFYIARVLLSFPVCLSSPLNPAIVLIICFLIFITNLSRTNFYSSIGNYSLKPILLILLPVFILSLYSLYLGSFNSVSLANQLSIPELYYRLLKGIYFLFTKNVAFLFLFGGILLQIFVFLYYGIFNSSERLKWIYLYAYCFCFIYIFLLPFGGYRDYRPEIIRYDTFIPITLVLIFLFVNGIFVLMHSANIIRYVFLSPLFLVLIIFTLRDQAKFEENAREREILYTLAHKNSSVIIFSRPENVISWQPISDPSQSVMVSAVLYKYHVTDNIVIFYGK